MIRRKNPTKRVHPNSIDRYVGNRMRLGRLALDITQARLGDALGVSFQQIQKYENGTNRVSATRLQQAAHFMRVPVSYFFDGVPNTREEPEGATPPPEYLPEAVSGLDSIRLIKAFARVKGCGVREWIIDLVEELAAGDPNDLGTEALTPSAVF